MKYRGYSARDFANDSFFIRWVRNPDEESDWFWKSFLRENPLCHGEIQKARELITLFDCHRHDLPESEFSSMRNHLLMSLRAEREEHKDNTPIQRLPFSKCSRKWLKLAAAIIVIPLLSAAAYLFIHITNNNMAVATSARENAFESRINPVGQKSVLFLSDGTKVWLNAASKIRYAKDFTKRETRDVYLEGEAFFDVAHNKNKTFIVHTSSIKIKVLGTSFNVKSYSDEKTIETTLVQGKVRIEQSDVRGNRIGDVELKPNQRAVFNKQLKVIKIKEVTAVNSGSWKRDRLVFDEESIDNVILQMERWYNIKVHVENKGNLDCKLTASIEKESLEEVLKLLEASHDIQYSIVGSEVFIEGTLCETNEKVN